MEHDRRAGEAALKVLHTLPHISHVLFPRMRGETGRSAKKGGSLNRTQFRTLMFLHHHRGATMSEACRHINLERGSFTSVADALIREGLAERVEDPEDRRKTRLAITERGEERAEHIKRKAMGIMEEKMRKLSRDELEALIKALDTLEATVKKLEKP